MQGDNVSNRIGWTAIAQRTIDYCSAEAKKVSGLSLTQSRALFHLAIYPGKNIGSVANSLNLRVTTAASALDVICRKGYAKRGSGVVNGRRCTQFFLTEDGYVQLPRYIDGFEKVFANFAERVGTDELNAVLQELLPDGTISMVLTCVDDTSLRPPDIYDRLHVAQGSDPDSALFDKAMYVEKLAWSLEEIDRHETMQLNRKERLVLRGLVDLDGEAEVRELRKCLLLKPATASSALRALQKLDYISRVDDPDNRRVVIASITETGREAEGATRADFEAAFDSQFPGFAEFPLPEFRD